MGRIEALLARGEGVLRVRDHPRQRATIGRLVAAGTLVRVYPGVVALPEALTELGRLRAVLQWIPEGVLHAETAAALWLDRPISSPIRVAAAFPRAARAGVQVTRRVIPPQFVVESSGLLVAGLGYAAAEIATADDGFAITEGLRRGICTPDDVREALAALSGTPGNQARRRIVGSCQNAWSLAERALQGILIGAGIRGWVANPTIRVAGQLLHPDLLFPEHLLIVEFDGYAAHAERGAFVRDREGQNLLVLGGYRVLRFTWEHVSKRPEYIVASVRAGLSIPLEGA